MYTLRLIYPFQFQLVICKHVEGNRGVKANDSAGRIATYVDRNIMQSGWLLGEEVIAERAAIVSVKMKKGKVVRIGFRPQHREQTHGTFKFVFNALVSGRQ